MTPALIQLYYDRNPWFWVTDFGGLMISSIFHRESFGVFNIFVPIIGFLFISFDEMLHVVLSVRFDAKMGSNSYTTGRDMAPRRRAATFLSIHPSSKQGAGRNANPSRVQNIGMSSSSPRCQS